jgi:MoxR-like ATPase
VKFSGHHVLALADGHFAETKNWLHHGGTPPEWVCRRFYVEDGGGYAFKLNVSGMREVCATLYTPDGLPLEMICRAQADWADGLRWDFKDVSDGSELVIHLVVGTNIEAVDELALRSGAGDDAHQVRPTKEVVLKKTPTSTKKTGAAPMRASVRSELSAGFIHSEDVADAVSSAMTSGRNLLLYGPAGHGKSVMVQAVMDKFAPEECFVQFFGEGMDEAKMFGGLDFARLDSEKVLEYNPERSFLASKYAVFEELFDAPPSVLLSLKDTLTARELRNGAQRFTMATKCIIAITNRTPSEISDLGASAHALVERFPLQLEVKWASYTLEDYRLLYNVLGFRGETANMLVSLVSRAVDGGQFISPRTAVYAYEILKAIEDAEGKSNEPLAALRFVAGLESLGDTILAEAEKARESAKCQAVLDKIEEELKVIVGEVTQTDKAVECLQWARELERVIVSLESVQASDQMWDSLKSLKETAANVKTSAISKATSLA